MRIAGAAVVLALAFALLTFAPRGSPVGGVGGGLLFSEPQPESWQTSKLLSTARGTLWWVDTRCRTGKLLLAERRIVRGPGNHCELWPSPDGETVLATQSDPDPPSPPARVVVLDSALQPRAVTSVRADVVHPPAVWSPGSAIAAICADTAHGTRESVLLAGSGVARLRLDGMCRPTYLRDDVLATANDRDVYVDGEVLQLGGMLAESVQSVPGRYSVEALAGRQSTLLVSVAHSDGSRVGPPGAVVRLDLESGATRTFLVDRGGYANELGISPDGSAFWYRGAGTGTVTLVTDRLEARAIPHIARSYAWSPDSRFLAVALTSGIQIWDLVSGQHVTIDELDPARLSWTL